MLVCLFLQHEQQHRGFGGKPIKLNQVTVLKLILGTHPVAGGCEKKWIRDFCQQ